MKEIVELDALEMEDVQGGGFLLIFGGCVLLAAICYYCGDHSAR